ncbi:DNA-processing protein DprA [Brachybacterium muris]|uniref:DNA processing protein DprA n=1 Tax=Brachybacterium muris UCD-AY4 TaxID=1249481 RepID=A0A022L324_9MICO|nr:DNA-processing protein DprA [Brachybacterium muris]EYT50238.1 DNA processing protein DprA [Brachybacterium muris UCD-AY4]
MTSLDHPTGPAASTIETARITWSLIAEPTDGAALAVRAALGSEDALDLARHGTVEDLMRHLKGKVPIDDSDPAPARKDPRLRAERALARWRQRLATVRVEEVLDHAAARGIRVLTPEHPQWPRQLEDLEATTPHCLWVHGPGDLAELVGSRSVAMVGSRASTPYGEDTASSLAASFARSGGTVVSGGAYGIDAAAHRGALAAEQGATIAVLAGGLDSLYPRGNTRLLEAIRERHLLVTEAPLGTAPTRWRFLARNRLIAALSQAVVVVEASWRSGALSTARHANGLSRHVGAVPGPITSAASAGCHRLIRDEGAVLVTEHSEVLDLLPGGEPSGDGRYARQDELDLLSSSDRRVLDAVPPRSSAAVATIGQEIGIGQDEARSALARLELLGLVEVREGRVRRARPR